jgi:CcmD family protein
MAMINALILQAPAETTRYMIAGYLVIFGVMSLYIISLIVRSRKLQQELETLKEMDQENK